MKYRCPECKSTHLRVEITTIASLYQTDDNIETDYEGGDHHWDDVSTMFCGECDFVGEAHEFE